MLLCRDNADELAHAAAVAEFNHSGDLGEQRVVLAQTDIGARFDARAALADDDGSTGHQLPAEGFDSEPLRIRVAPVFLTA
jgi:hypothetical protein